MLRGKERKKKNKYAKLIEVDEEDLHTLKINCKGERTLRKANKEINVEKNNNKFKKIKKEKREKKKGRRKEKKKNSPEQQNPTKRQRFITINNVMRKKKA